MLLSMACADLATAQQLVAPQGTRIALVVPDGFTEARGFDGFRHPDAGASIVVTQLKPGALPTVRKSYDPAALAERGMRVVSHTEISPPARRGFLVLMDGVEGGEALRKWVLAFEAEPLTGIVSVNVPVAALTPALEAAVVATLASVTVVPSESATGAGAASFRLGASSRLVPVDTRDASKVVYALADDVDGGPRLRATAHLGGAIRNTAEFAARLGSSVDGADALSLEAHQPFEAGGLPGLQATGRCTEGPDGRPCAYYHAMLFAEDGYFRFVGIAPEPEAAMALAEFRALVSGFRRLR